MEEQIQLQKQTSKLNTCPVCRATALSNLLEIEQIPVLSNVLWENRNDARSAPLGDLRLAFCKNCAHVFNQAFDPAMMEYDVQYENSLHFSPLFQSYATWLARYLARQYDLYDKHIIEIGSGKGEFLRLLCEIDSNRGTGFDPSYEPSPAESHPLITFIKDTYSERYAGYQADLILSRHVLEHIYQPAEFVQSLRRTIGSRKRTAVFCEVPNLGYILRDTAVWDLIYEHYSYFSRQSLADLFSRCGFNVLNLAEAFEGQFLYIEAIPREIDQPSPNTFFDQPVQKMANQAAAFAVRSQEKIARWREQVAALRRDGKRAVVWGAGSKGISFLNLLHIQDEIEYVVDINPRKHGKFITGSGQQIVPPDFLESYRPDTVIVMNPIYRKEIQGMLEQHHLQADFLFAS